MPLRISKNRVALSGIPLELAQSASIASAATVNLALATGNEVHITGSTGPITLFGTVPAGTTFTLIFDSTPTLTYNATSLILNTGTSDYTCAAGDRAIAVSEGSGNWVVTLFKKNGVAAGDVVTAEINAVTGEISLSASGSQLAIGSIISIGASSYYGFALRASQPGFGSPLDQSGRLNDPQINTTLFPAARQNSTAYSLNAYRSPVVLNGKLYKCTTAGTTAAAEPAGMAAAAIGATVTDGTAVWTVERGAWYSSASGFRHITSIAQGLLPASGALTCPAIAWDMAAGDSLIVRVRSAWNGAATDSRTALIENSVLGNRHISTARKGIGIGATGSTFCDLKLFISDGTTLVTSGHVSAGFTRKPLDGNVHDTVFMVDGLYKRSYCWTDGVAYQQSEMYSGSEKTPHNMDLSTVTGSTLTANNFMVGGTPGATSYDFGVMALDVLVLPARALPTNTQAIADFYSSRGADALLPASLLL